jgi:hypothetical protein
MGEIPTKESLLENGFDIKNEMIWVIGDEIEYEKMISELKDKGIGLRDDIKISKDEEPDSTVIVETSITVDRTIMRGLCKIGFNYLASQVGGVFILSENFNPIRNFIRFNEGVNSNSFILFNQPPILHEDRMLAKFRTKVTRGHLIVLTWSNDKLMSKISLFNEHTYAVCLCSSYKGIWVPIKAGHHFDLGNNQISELISVSKLVI